MDIQIKNVGRLSNLKLNDIARINYIVGENKSGKSSLLAGLLKLTGEARLLINRSPVNSYYRSDSGFEVHNYVEPYTTSTSIFFSSITVFSPFYSPDIGASIINTTKRDASKENLGVVEEQLQRRDGTPSEHAVYGFNENPEAGMNWDNTWNSVASGNKSLEYLRTKLKALTTQPGHITFVVIDEPEIHLHPKLHHEIHKLFLERIIEPSYYLFIATHSSYLIASSAKNQEHTKVYCLVDGKLINSTAYWTGSEHRARHLAEEAEGFKPSQCKLLVHDILGSTLENYFPKIIYCENSLKELIETFLDKNSDIYERPLIIPPGGDMDVLERTNNICGIINGLRSYREGQVSLLGPVAYGVIDKLNSHQTRESSLVMKVNQEHQNAIIILDKEEIEQSYPERLVSAYLSAKSWPEWDKALKFTEYLRERGLADRDIGIEKSELARYIGNNISIEEFTQCFGSIDSLLRV